MSDEEIIRNCSTRSEMLRQLGWTENGHNRKKLDQLLLKFGIDIPKLKYRPPYKWLPITKQCPVCSKDFQTQEGHPRETFTCSYACSNTYFRSGSNNPNYKDGHDSKYRQNAFKAKSKKHQKISCSRCSYDKLSNILQVHHKDRNRSNNELDNLEILCPNCHMEEHYLSKDGLWAHKKD